MYVTLELEVRKNNWLEFVEEKTDTWNCQLPLGALQLIVINNRNIIPDRRGYFNVDLTEVK